MKAISTVMNIAIEKEFFRINNGGNEKEFFRRIQKHSLHFWFTPCSRYDRTGPLDQTDRTGPDRPDNRTTDRTGLDLV
jgi:hypothetical protein